MQPLTLFHAPGMRSMRVVWFWLELRTKYAAIGAADKLPPLLVQEFSDMARFRETKPEWFLQLNPNGKLPVLSDPNAGGGTVSLFESCAIILYLLDMYDSVGLMGNQGQPRNRALMLQTALFASGTLDNLTAQSSPIQRAVVLEHQRQQHKQPVAPVEPSALSKAAWNDVYAPYFESLFANRRFLSGDDFTASDCILGQALYGMSEKIVARGQGESWLAHPSYPNVAAYAQRVLARPLRKVAYSATTEALANEPGVTVTAVPDP